MIFYIEMPNYPGTNRYVERNENWTNPLNGFVYFPLLLRIESIKHSIGVERSDCVLVLNNSNTQLGSGLRFSDLFQLNRIEGEQVDVYRFDESTLTTTLIFSGVIYRKSFNQETVRIEVVDSFSLFSVFVSEPVTEQVWPRVRLDDVGKRPQVTANLVEGMRAIVVADYKIGRANDVIDRSTTVVELDDVSQLSTGAAKLEREDVIITAIDTVAKTVTLTRAAPQLHGNGARVLMAEAFQVVIDGSTKLNTTLVRAYLENGLNNVIEAPAPDNVGQVNNVQVASWNSPPFIPRPTNEILAQMVEFNSGAGDAATPEQAAGKSSIYTEGNSAILNPGASDSTLTLTITDAYRRLGSIRKVLLQIDHSGNRDSYSSGNIDVSVGLPPAILTPIGILRSTDNFDKDYLELIEKKGARTVEVVTGAGAGSTSRIIYFSTVQTANSGAIPNDTKIDAGAESVLIDEDAVTSIIANLSKAQDAGQIDFTAPLIPVNVDPNFVLTQVEFKFRHGGASESGAFTGEILILTASPLAVIEGPGVFPQSGTVIEEVATMGPAHPWIVNGGAGRTVGELQDLIFQIRALAGETWELIEGFLVITYNETDQIKPAASVTNHFDITALVPSFDTLNGFVCQVVKQSANTDGALVYRGAIIVIYDEEIDELPDELFLDVQSDLTGTQAEIVQELWTGAEYANRPATDLNAASFAQAIADVAGAGYTVADIAGYFQDKSVLDAMIEISDAGRCQLTNYRGQLYLDYLALSYSVTTYSINDIRIVTPDVEIQSQDCLNDCIFNLTLRGNYGDRRGYELSLRSQSSAPFINNERDIDSRFAKSQLAILFLSQLTLAREGSIHNRLNITVNEDFPEKRPGQRFILDFGFFTTRVLEVKESEYSTERLEYQLTVQSVTVT